LPLLRYSNEVNGTEWLVITKLDVLDNMDWIPACTTYEVDGKPYESMPADIRGIEAIRPVYTRLKGWKTSTEGVRSFEELPKAAQEYLRFMEKESGAKIGIVSTGPDRDQTLELPEFREAMQRIAGR
jgi:adenylosuccinate synthase